MIQTIAPVIVAVVLIALSVIPQAQWTNRFSERETTAEQLAMAARLKDLPTEFGDWKITEEAPIDERSRRVARIVGDFSYRFQNKNDPTKEVAVMVVCGYGRDMRQHTPDQCYIAGGFTAADSEQHYKVDTKPTVSEFLTNRFRKVVPGQGTMNQRVFWAFSDDGTWRAPAGRHEIVTIPSVYKIYATTSLARDGRENLDESAAVDFLRDFLPVANKVLFPPKAKQAADGQKTSDGQQPESPKPEGEVEPAATAPAASPFADPSATEPAATEPSAPAA